MMIQEAVVAQAADICSVMHASIIQLCAQDHDNDQSKIDAWLESKTEDNCLEWITDSNSTVLVALDVDAVVGVAHIGNNGHLILCYLLPRVKGAGVGKMLLAAVEIQASDLGLNAVTLESTLTARGFYEHHGYTYNALATSCSGPDCIPLIKNIHAKKEVTISC